MDANGIELVATHAMLNGACVLPGPQNTPGILVPADVKALELSRKMRLGTYNEFRASLGFPKLTSFAQFTGEHRVDIAEGLASAYATPDDVELVVGMFVGQSNPIQSNPTQSDWIGKER